MAAPTMVVNMLLDRLVTQLTKVMITDVPVGDITRVDLVKKGLLQEDKLGKNIQLGVTGGDHEDPNFMDGIVDLDKMPNIGFNVVSRELGGGQIWWRRGVVRFEIFFVREKLAEDAAHEAGYAILGRLLSAIEKTNLSGCVDSFGERAQFHPFCYGNTMFESGGPPKSFIFRGKVQWQILTERP